MKITAAIPAALVGDANDLMMCLGAGLPDGETFRGLNWMDVHGNLYAASSFDVSEAWLAAVQETVVRPAWDGDKSVNVTGANRAQDVWMFSMDAVPAVPAVITVRGGVSGLTALAEMGLAQAPAPAE